MKSFDLREKKIKNSDPVESYFECISYCEVSDGRCLSRCVEILKENEY